MPPKPDLPPELADAIEFTAEYREAMGFFDDPESDAMTRVPSKKEPPDVDADRRADAR